jgi:hypothetical protein
MSQRWRVTFARRSGDPQIGHRELATVWNEILQAVVGAAAVGAGAADGSASDGAVTAGDGRELARPRVVFAAPLPTGMTADAELVDLVIPVGRLTLGHLREIVGPRLPDGDALVAAYDVWMGEPSLPSLVVAGDYRVDVEGGDEGAVRRGVASLAAASDVARPGRKPDRAAGNLRRLIDGVRVAGPSPTGAGGIRLLMRLRVDPELGSARPEEVVEVLGQFGPPLNLIAAHREGLVLRPPPVRVPKPPPALRLARRAPSTRRP